MYNSELFQSFLKQNGMNVPYQICLMTPEEQEVVYVDGHNQEKKDTFDFEHVIFEEKNRQHIENGCTYIEFSFPNDYRIRLHLFTESPLEENHLDMLYHLLYPIYAVYSLRASNYKLSKIIESIRHTTSSLDLEDLFANILTNTLEVIPNADLGTLWVFEPNLEKLVCKASVGNLLKGIHKMQFAIGEGIIGYTFKMGIPKLFRNVSELAKRQYNNIRPENVKYWDPSIDFYNNTKSMLVVPISVGERTECVMILCQIRTKHSLTEQDLHLLQGFSAQIGIALKNARLFTNVKKQNELLLKRDDIHTALTNLSLQEKGASKVVRELNRMIGQPLVFIDLIENESIPNQSIITNKLSFDQLVEFLSQISKKTYYDLLSSGELTHYIYPIRSGKVILGCIIIETKNPLIQMDHIALEQAESVLALELVKKQNLVEFYYKKNRELFDELVQTKEPAILQQKSTELGIKDDQEFVSVVFQFIHYSGEQELELQVHRLIGHLKRALTLEIQVIFGNHNTITLLAHLPSSSHLRTFKDRLERAIENWRNISDVILCGGIGSVYKGVTLIGKTFHEAKIALSYLVTRQMTGIIQYSEVGVNRLFINQNKEEVSGFLKEVFEPLRTPQSVNNTLEQTLITYFESNRSAIKAAKSLHIHINTLYQRLKKIEDCLQISFENPENVLRLQLACYLKETFE